MNRKLKLTGNVLWLTKDAAMLTQQIANPNFSSASLLDEELMDDVSTDEITPGWCCLRYDEKLADYAYLGLREGLILQGSIKNMAPEIIVSGKNKGCGSSREHAVYAEKYAGVKIIFAKSFSRIYQQNCHNVGILTCSDFAILKQLLVGESVEIADITSQVSKLDQLVLAAGGLLQYLALKQSAATNNNHISSTYVPRNYVEYLVTNNLVNVTSLKSYDVGTSDFITSDIRFSHEYVTPMAAAIFRHQFGDDQTIIDPEKSYFFADHLSLSRSIFLDRPGGEKLVASVDLLANTQHEFAERMAGHYIGASEFGGSIAICHNYILENVALPGQVIVGTDSHTCTAGALGALAFGIGATDMAGAWYNGEVQIHIPAVFNIELISVLPKYCSAKDIVLRMFCEALIKDGSLSGGILYFSGEGCSALSIDERATLCNMAVEAGAITGVFAVDALTYEFINRRKIISHPEINIPIFKNEYGFSGKITIDLSTINPMVSYPGDPKNAQSIQVSNERIIINKAYGGSCTGGKCADMDMYAEVFLKAQNRGMHVAKSVDAFIQVGSETVLKYIKDRGYYQLFEERGAKVLPPSCGACINAGPGVSTSATDVTVSAQNRNFPGRSGPGSVYLASPYTVAASIFAGYLTTVTDLFEPEYDN